MRRKTDLVNREKQLDSQVENLISEALALLKARLEDLGIQVLSITFINIDICIFFTSSNSVALENSFKR